MNTPLRGAAATCIATLLLLTGCGDRQPETPGADNASGTTGDTTDQAPITAGTSFECDSTETITIDHPSLEGVGEPTPQAAVEVTSADQDLLAGSDELELYGEDTARLLRTDPDGWLVAMLDLERTPESRWVVTDVERCPTPRASAVDPEPTIRPVAQEGEPQPAAYRIVYAVTHLPARGAPADGPIEDLLTLEGGKFTVSSFVLTVNAWQERSWRDSEGDTLEVIGAAADGPWSVWGQDRCGTVGIGRVDLTDGQWQPDVATIEREDWTCEEPFVSPLGLMTGSLVEQLGGDDWYAADPATVSWEDGSLVVDGIVDARVLGASALSSDSSTEPTSAPHPAQAAPTFDCDPVESLSIDHLHEEGAGTDSPEAAVAELSEQEGVAPGNDEQSSGPPSDLKVTRTGDDGRLVAVFLLDQTEERRWLVSGLDRCAPGG
ncbi:hypothetical protein [Ornithinimicrobium sp. Y1694]|uniref:hypothetical protein n=1 Tax=Ornithinimicrobium sp. Y1694 TaxID=3418590 RepID=UPI003CF5AAFF